MADTIEEIAGCWVRHEDMHPATNIANRSWMTADGEMHGRWVGDGSIPPSAHKRGILWHFPEGG